MYDTTLMERFVVAQESQANAQQRIADVAEAVCEVIVEAAEQTGELLDELTKAFLPQITMGQS
jgi:hypothetical protein